MKNHVTNVLSRLDLRDRTQAAIQAAPLIEIADDSAKRDVDQVTHQKK